MAVAQLRFQIAPFHAQLPPCLGGNPEYNVTAEMVCILRHRERVARSASLFILHLHSSYEYK